MRKFRVGLLVTAAAAALFYSGLSYLARAETPTEAMPNLAEVDKVAPDDGIAIYSKQIEHHPKNYVRYLRRAVVDSLFARGISKFLKEDWMGSREDFTRASELAPHNKKVAERLHRAQATVLAPGIYTASAEVPTFEFPALQTRDFYPVARQLAGLS